MLASCCVARKILRSEARASSRARTLDSRPTINGVIINGKMTTSRMGIIGSLRVSNFSLIWVTCRLFRSVPIDGFYHLPTFKNTTQGKCLLPEDFWAIAGILASVINELTREPPAPADLRCLDFQRVQMSSCSGLLISGVSILQVSSSPVSRFLTPIRAVPIFRSPRSSDPARWRAIPAIGAPRAHPPLPVHPTSSQAGPGHARFSRGWAEVIPDWRSFQRFCGTGRGPHPSPVLAWWGGDTPACAPYDSWTAGALACDRSIRFSDHSIFRSPDYPISATLPPIPHLGFTKTYAIQPRRYPIQPRRYRQKSAASVFDQW